MSILQGPAQALVSGDDTAAIADLKAAFDVQRRAIAADRRPSLDVRRERVGQIAPMMIANRERISASMMWAKSWQTPVRCSSATSIGESTAVDFGT